MQRPGYVTPTFDHFGEPASDRTPRKKPVWEGRRRRLIAEFFVCSDAGYAGRCVCAGAHVCVRGTRFCWSNPAGAAVSSHHGCKLDSQK